MSDQRPRRAVEPQIVDDDDLKLRDDQLVDLDIDLAAAFAKRGNNTANGRLVAFAQKVLSEAASAPCPPVMTKGKRDPNQPGKDRQDDILAALRDAGLPLTRPELIEAMKLKTEGKLGANLAWMVTAGMLINIPTRGYWPAGEPVPE